MSSNNIVLSPLHSPTICLIKDISYGHVEFNLEQVENTLLPEGCNSIHNSLIGMDEWNI